MATAAVTRDSEIQWLMDQSGLDDAQLEAYKGLLGDTKFKQMLIKLQATTTQAATDKAAAEQERLNLERKLNDEIYPEVRKVTQDSVRAQGELARAKAELEAARQYGIVPASAETTATATATATEARAPGSPDPQYVPRSEFDSLQDKTGRAILQLSDIQAEHFKLTGEPLANSTELYDALARERTLGHSDVTLRTVWERKYDIPKLRDEKAAATKQKELDSYADQKVKDYAAKHTDGSPQRVARESRFSTYDPQDTAGSKKPWQRGHAKGAENAPWRQQAIAKIDSAARGR